MLTPVKPCRSYTFITDAAGLAVDMVPDFRNLSANRAFWNDWNIPPEITLDDLLGFAALLKRELPDDLLGSLLQHLNLIRLTVPAQDAAPEQYPARRLDELLDKVLKELPAAIQNEGDLLAAFYPSRTFQENQDLWIVFSEMKRFHRAALRFRENFREKLPPVHPKFQPWHDDAIYIAMLIDRWWTSATGSRMHWASKTSPGNTFIADTLYRAGIRLGERGRPTGDTVKQALARHLYSNLLIPKDA